MGSIDYFIPGKRRKAIGPLARYVQPIPSEVALAYIESETSPDDIILDPFCCSETVVLEAIEAGRRVIAVNFNPVILLAIRALFERPGLNEAITRLGDSPKMGITLREHLEGLYRTTCSGCGRSVIADSFIWDREIGEPVEVYYRCESCGREGTASVGAEDLEALERMETKGFHYWYILDRIAPRGDENREQARRLLDLYTPRNLYALASILIKIETLFPDSPLQESLKSILLFCLEACSSLNSPEGFVRSLRPPRQFVERNVWREFEEAHSKMRQWPVFPQVTLARSLEEVLSPGAEPNAFVGAITVRRLARRLPPESVSLIVIDPPRFDHFFWSISYLWSGWLFGHEATVALSPLLKQRRRDWDWYQRAMGAAFQALHRLLKGGGHLLLIFNTEEQPFLEALILAASRAGFELEKPLYRPNGGGMYRLLFGKVEAEPEEAPDAEALAHKIRACALVSAEEVLRERGEPSAWPPLHLYIYASLSRAGYLQKAASLEKPLDFVAGEVKKGIDGIRGAILRLEENSFWLRDTSKANRPLADRVEEAIYEALLKEATMSEETLKAKIYSLFPGFLTPDDAIIEACLTSYGKEIAPGLWQIRPNEGVKRGEANRKLKELGRRLGYEVGVGRDFDCIWYEDGEVSCVFFVLLKATLGDVPLSEGGEANRFIVIPEERASLVEFKLRRNPALSKAVEEGGWKFIKYRHLIELAKAEDVSRYDLKRITGLRPIIEEAEAQIPLL